jgi:type VI protein secretion system component VasF
MLRMRSPTRSLDAISRWVAILLATALCTGMHAQQADHSNPPPLPSAMNPMPSFGTANSSDPAAAEMARQMALKRAVQRQQDIVDQTTKLLVLAQELKSDVDKSNKDQLSTAVIKKAEAIEKLAKSVKEKMRDGQ